MLFFWIAPPGMKGSRRALGISMGSPTRCKAIGINGFVACIPVGVDNGQLRDVVNQFLRNNAPRRHFAAAGLIAHAFADAFPCR